MTTTEYEKRMIETGSKRMSIINHICNLASGELTEATLAEVKKNLDDLLNREDLQVPPYNE